MFLYYQCRCSTLLTTASHKLESIKAQNLFTLYQRLSSKRGFFFQVKLYNQLSISFNHLLFLLQKNRQLLLYTVKYVQIIFLFSEKLPCVDRITYCDEFDERICTEERYGEYMRENCRRTCNLCRGIFKITFPR